MSLNSLIWAAQKGSEQGFFAGLGRNASGSDAPRTARGLQRVRQFIHNVRVQGDSADGFANLEAKPVYKGESYVVAALYDDEYVKQSGRWKFRKMRLTPFFMVPLTERWAGEDLLKMGR